MKNYYKILIIGFLIFPIQLFCQNSVEINTNQISDHDYYLFFTGEKRNLNKIRIEPLKRFFKIIGLSENLADGLTKFRNIHGEISGFNELYSAGFIENEVSILQTYFYIESSRLKSEDIIQNIDDEDELEKFEYYNDFLISPLNLNSASVKYIAELPGMDMIKANRIKEYRNRTEFGGLFDLTNAGISRDELLAISPFITIKPSEEKGFILNSFLSYDGTKALKLSNQSTNNNNSVDTYTYKFNLQFKNINLYFAAQTISNYLPYANWDDAYRNSRYNIEYHTDNIKLIGGQFKLTFGHNLLFGPSFIPPLSDIDQVPVKKHDSGIEPYYSLSFDSDNNKIRDLFNGAGFSCFPSGLEIFGFNPEPRITGFYSYFDNDDYHKITNQQDYGGNLLFKIPLGNTAIGLTAARQVRYDNKFNDTGLEFYYDSFIFDSLNIYGDAAKFGGYSFLQGLIFQYEYLAFSLLGFYSETNYNAPNAADIIHDSKNAKGFFTGFSFDFNVIEAQAFADISTKITNSYIDERYQVKLDSKLGFDNNFFNKLEMEIKEKYSSLSDGDNLRSNLYSTLTLFKEKLLLTLKWQDLLNFTKKEMGNMLTLKLSIKPIYWINITGIWNTYRAASYYSALFSIDEPLYPGDFGLTPYYGIGNEYCFKLIYLFSTDFEVGIKYVTDYRKLADSIENKNDDLSAFLQANF